MSLTDQINQDIKAAMKAKKKEELAALRAIKSALLLEATKGNGGEVSEEAEAAILQKLHKQRKESYDLYKDQGRDDLAKEELFQAEIIEKYLPEQMGEEEVRSVIQEIIQQTGAEGPSDMGKVMGAAMGKLKGKANGKMISNLAKEELDKR